LNTVPLGEGRLNEYTVAPDGYTAMCTHIYLHAICALQVGLFQDACNYTYVHK